MTIEVPLYDYSHNTDQAPRMGSSEVPDVDITPFPLKTLTSIGAD